MVKTDLNRLHKVHGDLLKMGSYDRRIGKTTYVAHCVAAHLCLLPPGTTIPVIVEDFKRIKHFCLTLDDILPEYDIPKPQVFGSIHKLYFPSIGSWVAFVTVDGLEKMHLYDRGMMEPEDTLLFDIEEMPGALYREGLSVEQVVHLYSVVKRRDQIKGGLYLSVNADIQVTVEK